MTEQPIEDTDDAEDQLDTIRTLSEIYFNLSQRRDTQTQEHSDTLDNIEKDINLLYKSLTNTQAEQ